MPFFSRAAFAFWSCRRSFGVGTALTSGFAELVLRVFMTEFLAISVSVTSISDPEERS